MVRHLLVPRSGIPQSRKAGRMRERAVPLKDYGKMIKVVDREAWQSGLMRLLGEQVYQKWYQRFESSRLRLQYFL